MEPKDARSLLAAYVRARMKKEEKERGRGYQAELARRTGLSSAHVANVMNRPHQGLGIEALTDIAGFWGLTLGQLEEAAKEWVKENPMPSARAPTQANLLAALDFMRGRGPVPDDVVDLAARVAEVGGDFSVQVWIALVHDLLETRAGRAAPTAAPASSAARRKRARG